MMSDPMSYERLLVLPSLMLSVSSKSFGKGAFHFLEHQRLVKQKAMQNKEKATTADKKYKKICHPGFSEYTRVPFGAFKLTDNCTWLFIKSKVV
jgi:hypothetical protein